MFMSSLVARCRAIVLATLAASAAPAPAAIVGIDFGGGTTPQNWTPLHASPVPISLSNLPNDTGAPTTVDLTLAGAQPGDFSQDPSAGTIPTHAYSLAGIGEYWFGVGPMTATFSDLPPSSDFRVWVFGLRAFAMNNRVTIAGAGAPVTFDQVDLTPGNLWINGALGSSANSLLSYAQVHTSTAAGTITISWLEIPNLTAGWAIGGLAIEPAPAPATIPFAAAAALAVARRRRR